VTATILLGFSVPRIPRPYLDVSTLPLLRSVSQPDTYGPDTVADMYGAKVVLNDVSDMYTKARLEQTPLEASTWTKEESAPYPPLLRLTHAAMFAAGELTGIGFYGLTLGLAALFIGGSAWYFLQTRWYLFPLLYLNAGYVTDRFVYVQDGSYLVMLVWVMAALVLARQRHRAAPVLMGVATAMKLLPLAYLRNLRGRGALAFLAILLAGLVLPFFIWEHYGYIYQFANERKGNDWLDVAGAVMLVAPFTLVLWYVEDRRGFDTEDRIGSSLVPFAMFSALLANSGRHLLIALIVPDKRAGRNVAAAAGLALHGLFPSVVRLGSMTYVMTAVLCVVLAYELRQIGWSIVLNDARHPGHTLRMLIAGRAREMNGETV
jgi:hypothetical protein